MDWSNERQVETLAWVGHAPDVDDLAAALLGGGRLEFAKGAVAAIEFDGQVAPGQGTLAWLATMSVLGA